MKQQGPATTAGFRSVDAWERAAFWLLLALHLLPLCSGRYFPTADGPTHLYNAWLWKAMLLHPDQPGHQVLAFNPNPEPNYLSHLLLAGLLTFLPPWLAEKLVLLLYVAGLPLALRYALRGTGQAGAGWLAILGFPFIYSAVLLWGFYNFCLSLVLLLLVLGYWLRHTRHWTLASVAALCGLATLLYFAHPMTYLVSGLLLGLQVVASRWQPAYWRAELGKLLLAYLPTLLLLGWYAAHKGSATSAPALNYGENLWDWLRLEPIRYFSSAETTYRWVVTGILAIAIGWVASRVARRRASGWAVLPWALGVLVLLGAYVAMPDAVAGGSITRPRWGLLSYFTLLGGLAAVPWPPRQRFIGLGAGALAAALLLGFRLPKLRAFQAGIAEYESLAPHLRTGATILPITYATDSRLPETLAVGTYIPVLLQAVNYLATEHQLLSYQNYEAGTGYFPLRWQPGKEPTLASTIQPAPLAPFLAAPGHQPTYVLLQNRQLADPASAANAAAITSYLAHFHYRLGFRSPTGLLELYERPASPPARN